MTLADRVSLFDKIMGGRVSDEFRIELINRGFFTAPASTKYHGSYEGGLFDHSYAVTKHLVELTEKNNIHWEDERSPYIVGMFHDLCKMDNYLTVCKEGEVPSYVYNDSLLLRGHGDKSVMMLSEFTRMTEEEILCIRYHMGAFTEKEEWRDYTRAVNKYATVLWTHTADMLASHVEGV